MPESLAGTDRRWLIVLDDLTEPADLSRLWSPSQPHVNGIFVKAAPSGAAWLLQPTCHRAARTFGAGLPAAGDELVVVTHRPLPRQ